MEITTLKFKDDLLHQMEATELRVLESIWGMERCLMELNASVEKLGLSIERLKENLED